MTVEARNRDTMDAEDAEDEEIPELSGSEEPEGPITTRSRSRNTGTEEGLESEELSSSDYSSDMDEDDEYMDEDDEEYLDSEEEEEAMWAALAHGSMLNPQFAQRIWGTREPTREQRDEFVAYFNVIRQADQMEDHTAHGDGSVAESRGSGRRARSARRSPECCALESAEGQVVKAQYRRATSSREPLPERSGPPHHISSSYGHFQVADGLLCNTYDGVNDELVLVRSRALHLYTVPRAPSEDGVLASEEEDLDLGINPYTMARSANGDLIAVGGECQIMIVTYNREKRALRYGAIIVFHNHSHRAEMPYCNSVRFGKVGGRERLLGTNQNGNIYVFEVPSLADIETAHENQKDAAALFMCSSLYDNSWNPFWATSDDLGREAQTMRVFGVPVATWLDGIEHSTGQDLSQALPFIANMEMATNVIGKFPIALNCAVPSPDSKWIAAVGDSQMIFICPVDKIVEGRVMRYSRQVPGFASPSHREGVLVPHVIRLKLPVKFGNSREFAQRPFSQYCNWNASSSLLAVSSDNAKYVAVFSVDNWQCLRVFDSVRPCLPVAFLEGFDATLVWSEDIGSHVTVGNVGCAQKRKERCQMDLPERINRNKRKEFTRALNHLSGLTRGPIDGQRITGLGTSASFADNVTTVYTATTELVSRHRVLSSWTPETHHKFVGRKHRRAVRQVLMGAYSGGSQNYLKLLPEPLLLKIIGLTAFPLEDWA